MLTIISEIVIISRNHKILWLSQLIVVYTCMDAKYTSQQECGAITPQCPLMGCSGLGNASGLWNGLSIGDLRELIFQRFNCKLHSACNLAFWSFWSCSLCQTRLGKDDCFDIWPPDRRSQPIVSCFRVWDRFSGWLGSCSKLGEELKNTDLMDVN